MKFHCVLLNGVEVVSLDPTKTEIKTLGVWRDDLLTMRTEAEIEAAPSYEDLQRQMGELELEHSVLVQKMNDVREKMRNMAR